MSTELVELARAGDEAAFRELAEPYRAGLHAHCYRILGSVQDAEDALRETLLAAWRGLAGFQERASVRMRLYSIATNRALNMLRAAKRRPTVELWMPEAELPEPTGRSEPLWLEPYPDVLLEDEPGADRPEARYEAKEAISLAFVAALQLLPARQRAVLILRDVLGFRAAEVAGMLDTSVESVTSAPARPGHHEGPTTERRATPAPRLAPGATTRRRLAAAFEASDVDGARRLAHRGRAPEHAAFPARVHRSGGRGTLLHDRRRRAAGPPHRADEGERAAGAGHVPPRPHRERVPRHEPARGHPRGRAGQRDHPLRRRRRSGISGLFAILPG